VTAPARFTKADVKRAASGVAAAGFTVSGIVIDPNGKITILTDHANRDRGEEGWEDLK